MRLVRMTYEENLGILEVNSLEEYLLTSEEMGERAAENKQIYLRRPNNDEMIAESDEEKL